MFFYPHMVVAVIPRKAQNRAKVEFEGLCSDDFIKARIPCSFDQDVKWIGPREKRVEVEGTLSLMMTNTTERIFIVGTMLILKHLPGVIWQVERVEHNDGVFISGGTFDLLLSRHGQPVPPTGDLRKYLDEFGT